MDESSYQDYECVEVTPTPEHEGYRTARLQPLRAYVSGVDMISDRNGQFGKFDFRVGGVYRLTELPVPPE